MTTKLIAYRIQLLVLCLSLGLFIFQLEPIMANRGIPRSTIVNVFSAVQVISILATLLWGKFVHGSKYGYRIIRIGILIRIVVIALMYFHFPNTIFIALAILYNTVAGSVDFANETQLMKWTGEEKQNFGRIRMFASFGYSISGIVASLLLSSTGSIDSVIIFALVMNVIFMILSFYRPIKVAPVKVENKKSVKLDGPIILLMFLILLTIALPNSFGILLNLHYRDALGTTLSTAVFLSGISILLSSGVSEIISFWYIDRVIEKIGAPMTIFIGIAASILRWSMASLFDSPWIFTLSFLFHGINFVFMYIGFMTIIRKWYSNDSIGKVMTIYSAVSSVMTAIVTFSFNLILMFSNTTMILYLFIGISLILSIIFYKKYIQNPLVYPNDMPERENETQLSP